MSGASTAQPTIEVSINGEARRFEPGRTLSALLTSIGVDATRVAVERNLEIVARSSFGEVEVADGDCYEIVHFVGGG